MSWLERLDAVEARYFAWLERVGQPIAVFVFSDLIPILIWAFLLWCLVTL